MTSIRKALAILFLSLMAACAPEVSLQGHHLRVFAIDQPDASWITQDDVTSAERGSAANGQPTLRLYLRPEAAQRMLALTSANIGKTVRFTWDGKVISELKVVSEFGSTFELPAPPI